MALAATVMYEIRQDATGTGNTSGGGFNPGNANFFTDLAATSGTGNSPVVTSATYTFQASDDEKWIYVKSGTDWTAGFYQIASVSGGAATLRAAVGEAVQFNTSQGRWAPNAVAGCATVASPTGGTFGMDYSQQAAAEYNLTGVTTAAADAILLTASAALNMIGNHVRIVSGTNFTTGWYEVVSVVAGVSMTLDRTCTSAAGAAGVVNVGGAMSLNSTLDDDFFEIAIAGNIFWVKYNASAISLGEAVSISAAGGASKPIKVIGFTSVRGDSGSMPTISAGANPLTLGANWDISNIEITGTGTAVLIIGGAGKAVANKTTNKSTTAGRSAISASAAADSFVAKNNCVSYRGVAIFSNTNAFIAYNYAHDSNVGIADSSTNSIVSTIGNIVESCVTAAINLSAAHTNQYQINENTLFGSANTTGIGCLFASGVTDVRLVNNIISGFVTGVDHADTQTAGFDDYNCYYNNDADVSAVGEWQKGPNDVATNPSFTNVGQVTGSTATTTAGDHLVQSGATFITSGVVAGRDYVYIISGTGVTAGIYGILSVDSETQITTDITLSANATADKVFQITTGRNFLPTGSI